MKTYSARFITAAYEASTFPPAQLPELAVVGRSNCGKSTLINVLVGRRGLARVSQRPGRTRAVQFYDVEGHFVLVDLPGYGFATAPKEEKAGWKSLVKGYLQHNRPLKGVMALFDIRRQTDLLDAALLDMLRGYDLEWQAVWTKADKLKVKYRSKRAIEFDQQLSTLSPGIVFSGKTRLGREELLDWVERRISG